MEHGTVCTAVRPVGLFHAAILDQCAGKVAVCKDGSPEGTAIGHHLFKACFLSSDALEITGEQGCLCKIREAQLRLRQIRFIHSGSCEDGAVQSPMTQIQTG